MGSQGLCSVIDDGNKILITIQIVKHQIVNVSWPEFAARAFLVFFNSQGVMGFIFIKIDTQDCLHAHLLIMKKIQRFSRTSGTAD